MQRKHLRPKSNTITENTRLQKTIEDFLFDDQSPELISGRIRRWCKDLPNISGVTIRSYIKSPYGRRIEAHRVKVFSKRRRKRKSKPVLANKRMIDTRPKIINERKRIGDAEGDFVESGKSGKGMLFVVSDRKARSPFLEKIYPVSIPAVERALARVKKRYPELTTITFDNDLLFIHHRRLEKKFHIKVYFCHTYAPYEKGGIENRNKLIRRYIPKGSDISVYSRYFIKKLEEKLQRRIMKCVHYLTPKEVLDRHRKRKKKR